MRNLTFTIEHDGEYNYLVYLTGKSDVDIDEHLYDSFGISIIRKNQLIKTPKNVKKMYISEYICSKINDVLDRYWDVAKLGIPVIKLQGDLDTLDPKFCNSDILLYTNGCTSVDDISQKWIDELSSMYAWPNTQPILFLSRCDSGNDGYGVVSDSMEFVLTWLAKNKCCNAGADTIESKIDKIMRNWYSAEEYATLTKLSEQAIMNFVVIGRINMYIPSYLTVPSYHIRRFKKAQDTLESYYHPKFIMTIPIYRGNNSYTVLLPIMEDITTDTVRR